VVELDGRMHMDVAQWTADLDRQNEIGLTNRLVLRFALWTLRTKPDHVARPLERALHPTTTPIAGSK
jgi:very-short-patch-repair endonuclease